MATPRIDRLENGIINAPMELWQRVVGNTTTVNTATGQAAYTADRMLFGTAGGTVKNFSILRSTDVPSQASLGSMVPYSYRFNCLTAIISPVSADVVAAWQYRVEGFDYSRFHANASTFAFWIKVTSSATFPISIPVSFGNNSRTYVTTVSVAASATWQQCFVNIQFESSPSGYAFDNTLGMKITVGAGAVGAGGLAASANTWAAGDSFSLSGAFNSMGVSTNVVQIAAPQLVLGTFTSTTGLSFGRAGKNTSHELQLCQRYYEKSYNVEQNPGTAGFLTEGSSFFAVDTVSAVGQAIYRTPKRSGSTVTVFNPSSGASGAARDTSTGVSVAVTPVDALFNGFYRITGTLTVGRTLNCHWTSDAEL